MVVPVAQSRHRLIYIYALFFLRILLSLFFLSVVPPLLLVVVGSCVCVCAPFWVDSLALRVDRRERERELRESVSRLPPGLPVGRC